MERWEYKTLKMEMKGFWSRRIDSDEMETELNELGRDGWELISCFDTSQYQGESKEVVAVFKRRLI